MENVLQNYRNNLKNAILEDSGMKYSAKFTMHSDGHPCQWTLVEDILKNDLQLTWKRTTGSCGSYGPMLVYYITGHTKKETEIVTDEFGNKFKIYEVGNDIKVMLEEKAQKLPEGIVSIEDVN